MLIQYQNKTTFQSPCRISIVRRKSFLTFSPPNVRRPPSCRLRAVGFDEVAQCTFGHLFFGKSFLSQDLVSLKKLGQQRHNYKLCTSPVGWTWIKCKTSFWPPNPDKPKTFFSVCHSYKVPGKTIGNCYPNFDSLETIGVANQKL